MKRLSYYLIALCLSALASFASQAHEARPLLVEISEKALASKSESAAPVYQYELFWRIPPSLMEENIIPEIQLPQSCKVIGKKLPPVALGKQLYICDEALSGQKIGLEYPGANPSVSSLFRIKLASGEQYSNILKPGVDHWQVPAAEDTWSIAKDYTGLGIEHIWAGIDHLLFVACLIFIARRFKRIVITITGFTIAHSITLALSTLNIIALPVPPVEAVIALSIVFLAHEIASKDETSWTYRFPVIVSSSFGLLHGFGFAAVLNDLGLPQTELATALLCFNLGVEIGQLLFILLCSGLFMLLAKGYQMQTRSSGKEFDLNRVQTLSSYAIGCIASYWMLERFMGFWA